MADFGGHVEETGVHVSHYYNHTHQIAFIHLIPNKRLFLYKSDQTKYRNNYAEKYLNLTAGIPEKLSEKYDECLLTHDP